MAPSMTKLKRNTTLKNPRFTTLWIRGLVSQHLEGGERQRVMLCDPTGAQGRAFGGEHAVKHAVGIPPCKAPGKAQSVG